MKKIYFIIAVLLTILTTNNSFSKPSEGKQISKDGYQIDTQVSEDDFAIDAEFNESEKETYRQMLYRNKNRILIGAAVIATVVGGAYYYKIYHFDDGSTLSVLPVPGPEINNDTPKLYRQTNQILDSCKDKIALIEGPFNTNTSSDPVRIEQDLEFYHTSAFDALRDSIKKFGEDHQWEQEQLNQLEGQAQVQVQEIEELRTACDRERTRAERYQDNPRYQARLVRAQASLATAQNEADGVTSLIHQNKANILRYQSLETEARTKLQEIGDACLARGYGMTLNISEPVFNIN